MTIEAWLLEKVLKLEKEVEQLTKWRNETMATMADVKVAIQTEKEQSAAREAKLAELQSKVEELSKQVADGAAATAEQLDEIVNDIKGIVADPVVEPEPVNEEPAPVEEPVVDGVPVELPADVEQPVA